LPAALAQHPLAKRAVEELKMLAQTDVDRERYEARRKAQMDYNTGLKVARLEGREAEKIHTIHLLERLLHRSETPSEELSQRSLEELSQMVDQLLAQMSPQP
jgi:hypothetical protein